MMKILVGVVGAVIAGWTAVTIFKIGKVYGAREVAPKHARLLQIAVGALPKEAQE